MIDTVAYSGFGGVTSESTPANGDCYKYTGRELDSGTGLQYNWHRYLDPLTMRWISQDPLGFSAGDENLYRYIYNKIPNTTDPTGLVDDADFEALTGLDSPQRYDDGLSSL